MGLIGNIVCHEGELPLIATVRRDSGKDLFDGWFIVIGILEL